MHCLISNSKSIQILRIQYFSLEFSARSNIIQQQQLFSPPKNTRLITREPATPRHAVGCKCKMTQKRNVVLYLDTELVKKSRELGFNLSKTFENHLKRLVNHAEGVYGQNNSHDWWAGPDLNQRPSARQADVLTELDYRPPHVL